GDRQLERDERSVEGDPRPPCFVLRARLERVGVLRPPSPRPPPVRAPPASDATTPACGPPLRSCHPSPTTSPAATTTAPTTGFGRVVPRPRSASSIARSR